MRILCLDHRPSKSWVPKISPWVPPKGIRWTMGLYISLVHLLGIVGLTKLFEAQWKTCVWAFLLWFASCLGITAGAHRLWSHRSYKAGLPLRTFLMLCQSLANQGSILHWARDHRTHHKHSETPADPHNARRGFIFAHIGWLFLKKDRRVIKAGNLMNLQDLYDDPVVMLQKKMDPWLQLFMCFIMPGWVAYLGWGENFWIGIFVAGAFRYVVALHCTWLVNSAAHMWGSRPYDPQSNPAENSLVAIGSIGEGWHNWHHAFPFDYAASELNIIDQWNPTKAFIDICVSLGLAYDTKRALNLWKLRKKVFEERGTTTHVYGPKLFKQRKFSPPTEA
mmetsp:Transcript_14738/g.20485  ORF Transcript_14738/g.20485 Transcript_14738/m.20485 type:complete len:335 (-) Transcript_14738:277-1281(-)